MANGHSPSKPPGQGSFGPVHTSKPIVHDSNSGPKVAAPASTVKKGIHTPGVGGSKKS